MSAAGEVNIGTVVSWRGEDFVIQRAVVLRATAFAWRLLELSPAGQVPRQWIALTGQDVWAVDSVHGIDDAPPLEVDVSLLKTPRPAESLSLGQTRFELVRFGEAVAEMQTRGRPAAFDKGRLLEYAGPEGRRLVIYVSDRRQLAFVAQPASASELEVYGQAES